MMNQENNKAIALIAHLIVLNNAGGTARALTNAGYERKTFIDDCELELILLRTYLADKKKFFEVMNTIPWHYGETRTNKSEIKEKLIALTNIMDSAESKGDWWKQILILLNT